MRAYLLLVSVFLSFQLRSQPTPNRQKSVFDTVKTAPYVVRIDVAHDVYYQKVRRSDSVFAIKSIKELIAIADNSNDKILRCFAISTLADHYARMRGLNQQSTQLHLEAIRFSHDNDLDIAEGASVFRAGRYFYNQKQYPLAFEYLLRAESLLSKIGYADDLESDEFLIFFANIYYNIGDYERAENLYIESLKYSTKNHFLHIQAKNTLASIAKEEGRYDKALAHLKEVLQIATINKDTTWQGLSTGFIGDILFFQNKTQEAIPYLKEGYMQNIKRNEWIHANLCVLDLASISISNNQLQEAEQYIKLSAECMSHSSSMDARKHRYEVLIQYNESKGNYPQALIYEKKLRSVEDSIKTKQDSKVFTAIEMKYATQKHSKEIIDLEVESRKASIKRNVIIFILSALVIAIILVYRKYRLKAGKDAEIARQKHELLESEKQITENELRNAELQLLNFTENLRHKNELLEDFRNEIDSLKKTTPEAAIDGERIENFERLLHSTILTDEEWDNFRMLFDKVHRGFFFNLKEKIPNLSLAETRMCSLVKLQLSNREMAHISGVSIDAIKKAKQRLRKKITSEEIELEEILQTI